MANILCFKPVNSFNSTNKPASLIGTSKAPAIIRLNNDIFRSSRTVQSNPGTVKATGSTPNPNPNPNPNPGTKLNSLICNNCDGNGAVLCSQCQGSGVNSVDHFNGQFKAGSVCWLCRGKKDMLCGNCNGAGFIGGFMSTFDE